MHDFIPFSAQTRMSGVDIGSRKIRKGAADQVVKFVRDSGGRIPDELEGMVERIAQERRHAAGGGGRTHACSA